MNESPLYKHNTIDPRSWNKYIFVVAYRSIFIGFTISISNFQVFCIFFILSFLYISGFL